MKVTTRWECMRIVAELCYVCNEVVKTCRAHVNLASAQKWAQNWKYSRFLMRRDGGPSTKTRRGASDWGSETRHAAGE